MSVGPHVFGDGRVGCWITPTANLGDKLRDRLPRIRRLAPQGLRVTDIFLPPEATIVEKRIVVEEFGFFAALYEPPPHGRAPGEYAAAALADTDRLKMGALELNIEGVRDDLLAGYVTQVVRAIRAKKPALRLRLNVVPWKGGYLPVEFIKADPQLYVIVQCYLGNMDARVAEDEIVRNLTDFGIPGLRVSVMYGAHISWAPGKPRVPSLPQIRYRGSIYTDDLLTDAGYLA